MKFANWALKTRMREILEERKEELEMEQPRLNGLDQWLTHAMRIKEINYLLMTYCSYSKWELKQIQNEMQDKQEEENVEK